MAIESLHETIACSIVTRLHHSGDSQLEYVRPNSQTALVDRATYATTLSCEPIYDIATGQGTSQDTNESSEDSSYTPVQAVYYHMVTGAQDSYLSAESRCTPNVTSHPNNQYTVASVQMDKRQLTDPKSLQRNENVAPGDRRQQPAENSL